MADPEELIPSFDPTLKKKKKKKKVDLDLGDDAEEATDGVAELSLDDPTAMFGKKKKKKNKDSDNSLEEAGEAGEEGMGDLSLKKKKKKKKVLDLDGLEDLENEEEEKENTATKSDSGLPWDGSMRDYHYEELLGRVFGMLRANNPELAGEKQKTILKPPQVRPYAPKARPVPSLLAFRKAVVSCCSKMNENAGCSFDAGAFWEKQTPGLGARVFNQGVDNYITTPILPMQNLLFHLRHICVLPKSGLNSGA
eukprot:6435755-Pyramimonas_sp.AAC.1